MDWNALVIGLVGGLAGSALGGGIAVLAVLLQADAEVDREIRDARRAYRQTDVARMRNLLEVSQQYLTSMFQRSLWDGERDELAANLKALGLTDDQITAAHEFAKDTLARFPVPAEVVRDFSGVIFAIEDEDLANHLMLLQMELIAKRPEGWLQPHQTRYLVVKTRLLIERYASTVPLEQQSFIKRLRRATGLGGRSTNRSSEWDSASLERLTSQVKSIESTAPRA